ncbi:MAG: glycosyltransferase, partial [Candidatus Omnitrophica bacterium]|nr:glycosyltransferase [Candidatus Omnitrophota bacterium]
MFPFVSIIIVVKENNRFLEECVTNCLKLDYPFYEVIILPDDMIGGYNNDRIKVIPTGNTLPAAKRDIGSENAGGEILAFLDDDTYPVVGWLKQAVLNFNDDSVACVCGPAVTPKDEPFLNKASGLVFESFIVSGPARFRYIPLKKRFTDDYPSCNLLIRKEIFQKIGGFKTKFWPGEDTILCLEVVHNLNKKIIYDPLALVYHHRRTLFKKHLAQVANYALHRGYFLKRYPKTSFKLGYFAPSLIILALLISLLFGMFLNFKFLYLWLAYFAIVLVFSFNKNIGLFIHV